MTEPRELARVDARQDALGRAVVLRLQLPIDAMRFLDRAVIVIARAGGGAGADGLAALLTFMAESAGSRVTLVDFSLAGDEGPAWDRSHTCKRLTISSQLGADLGDVIAANPDGIIIINTLPNTLLDIVGVEPEFLPILRALERPYVVIWIDRPDDQKIDRIGGYRRESGAARCIVGVLAKADDRFGDAQRVNVHLPDDLALPVKIPLLPSQIASFFYSDRMTLREAVDCATVGHKSTFYTRLAAFASELRDAL